MSDLKQRLDALSPDKRARLEQLLMSKRSGGSRELPIPRRTGGGPAPLSFEQQRLLFLDQLAPGSPTYNAAVGVSLTGPLNLEAMSKTFDSIVERHEVLRTTYRIVNREPVQEVQPTGPAGMRFLDVALLPEEKRQRAAERVIREECRRPFNLAKHLMMRTLVVRLSEGEHILLIVAHHIACDGWTRDLLFDEISRWYAFHAHGTPAGLTPLAIQYSDFAAWQREYLDGAVLEERRAYWKQQLAGCPAHITLPFDFPRPPTQVYSGAHFFFEVPAEVAASVAALTRQESSTLFIAYLAALKVFLHALSGQDDILVGTPMANRRRVETEPLMGFFANTVVLRTRIAAGVSFRALLTAVKKMALEAYTYQDMPLGKLVEDLRLPRDFSRNPLFQVNFRVRTGPGPELTLPDVKVRHLNLDIGTSKFDLALELSAGSQSANGFLEYNTALFRPETIERFSVEFIRLTAEAVAHPDAAVTELESFRHSRQNAAQAHTGSGSFRFTRPRKGVDLAEQEFSAAHSSGAGASSGGPAGSGGTTVREGQRR